MRRVLPGTRHLDRRGVGVADPAHPLDDPLGEQHPELLVVVELRMALEARERRRAARRRSRFGSSASP